jgi:hypothetical protein
MQRRQQIIRKRGGERIAALVIEKFLEQGSPYALREATGDLPLNQRRIDGATDIIANDAWIY